MPFGDCGDDTAVEYVNEIVNRAALILYENYLNLKVFSYTASRTSSELVELMNVIEMARRCQCNFSVGVYDNQEAAVQDIDLWTRKLTPIKPMTAKYHIPLSTSRTSSSASQHKMEENKCIDTHSITSSHISKAISGNGCTSPNKKRTLKDAVVVKVVNPRPSADDRQAEETRRKTLLMLVETMTTQSQVEAPEKDKKQQQKKKPSKAKTYSIHAPAINVEPVEDAVRVEFNVADIGEKVPHIHLRPPTRSHEPSRDKPPSARSLHPQDSFNENLSMPNLSELILHSEYLQAQFTQLKTCRQAAVLHTVKKQGRLTKIQDRQTQKIPVTRKQSQRSHPQYVVQVVRYGYRD
ncbi:hypothetical protein THRCLA_07033 [Thraustotheca clavata]|uniref:Uncharacterized protein n=1 Tax=Thraustotheca clavata TaxID=74557 RepID=A0A1V9ZH18_9STRA|nr:hypothetical protein THRCLA_07033 [Thraustotheca clavata]